MQALGMIEVIGLPPAIEAADAALKAANVKLLAIAKADAGILTVEVTGDVGAVNAAVEAGAAAAQRVGTLRAKHIIPHVDESLVGKVLMKGTKLFQPKKKEVVTLTESEVTKYSNSQEDGTLNKDTTEQITLPVTDSFATIKDENNSSKTNLSLNENLSLSKESQNIGKDDIYGEVTLEKPMIKTNSTEKATVKNPVMDTNVTEKVTTKNPVVEPDVTKKVTSQVPVIEHSKQSTTYTVTDLKKKSNDTLRAILQSEGVTLTEAHKNAKKQELIQLIIAQQNRR